MTNHSITGTRPGLAFIPGDSITRSETGDDLPIADSRWMRYDLANITTGFKTVEWIDSHVPTCRPFYITRSQQKSFSSLSVCRLAK